MISGGDVARTLIIIIGAQRLSRLSVVLPAPRCFHSVVIYYLCQLSQAFFLLLFLSQPLTTESQALVTAVEKGGVCVLTQEALLTQDERRWQLVPPALGSPYTLIPISSNKG